MNLSKLLLGALFGVAFGIVDILLMIPIEFPPEKNKTVAMGGAFVSRFAIGFVIGASKLPLPGWLSGVLFGLLISLPDAIITGAFIPILPVGAIGGSIIGYVVGRYGK